MPKLSLSVLATVAFIASLPVLTTEASPKTFEQRYQQGETKAIAQSIASSSTNSLISELTPEQSRRMRSKSPYGYSIITYWSDGDRFLKQEQFDSAIAEFRKAVNASKVFNRTDFTDAQNLRLKQCAIAGSEARLQVAIAARDFYKKNNRRQSAVDEALAVYQRVFNSFYEQAEAKNPQLASGCP